jgi:ATP-dependent DNA ligase
MPDPTPDAAPILPQRAQAADAIVSSVAWLFEPYWRGDRLLAHLSEGRVSLTDQAGEVVDAAYPDAVAEIAAALDAEQALIDGIWTGMPFVGDGAAARMAEALAADDDAGTAAGAESGDPLAHETRRAFVAIDLLEVDGTPLYDVPLLERRRLLASVLAENVRVRISPAVKVPIQTWVDAWRHHGFDRYVAKHVNSRYSPGEVSEEWLILPTAPESPPNILARLMGKRPRKLRHIEDSAAR